MTARRRQVLIALTIFASLVLSFVTFATVQGWERDRIRAEFTRRADIRAASLQRVIDQHLKVLESIEAFYAASESIERDEFRMYTGTLRERQSGIQALFWIPRVRNSERASYEAGVRKEGFADFQITERPGREGMRRVGSRSEYFPVSYRESSKASALDLGFDLASDPAFWAAMARACDTEATVANGLRTFEEDGKPSGCLVFHPIYRNDVPHKTRKDRRANLFGFVAAVFGIKDMVEASLGESAVKDVTIHLFDQSDPAKEESLYESDAGVVNAPSHSGEAQVASVTNPIHMAGRKWTLVSEPTAQFLAVERSRGSWGILAAGLLITALLAAYLWNASGHTARIEVLVGERTAALDELRASSAKVERRTARLAMAHQAIREAAGQLSEAAEGLLASTARQAAGSQEQAAAVRQTVASVDQVTGNAADTARRAQSVGEVVQRNIESGRAGRKGVEDSIAALNQLKTQVESTAENILALAERAQTIGEIITIVGDIAEQTNLLALNAAIEASRVGEQGRAFAVVAGEVKALADQSRKATAQVRQILGEILSATNTAAQSAEHVSEGVVAAIEAGSESGQTMETLANTLAEAAEAAAQIVTSAGQQANGMAQIARAMKNLEQVAQNGLAATYEVEQAAQALNILGSRLAELVE